MPSTLTPVLFGGRRRCVEDRGGRGSLPGIDRRTLIEINNTRSPNDGVYWGSASSRRHGYVAQNNDSIIRNCLGQHASPKPCLGSRRLWRRWFPRGGGGGFRSAAIGGGFGHSAVICGGGYSSGGFVAHGFHDGHFHHGFHGRRFLAGAGLGFGVYAPYAYYDDYYDYPAYTYDGSYYDDGGCYVVRRSVHTRHGWRIRPVRVCG